jgi:hypothetical protein
MATQDADGVVARANISVGILLSSEVNPTPRLAETIPASRRALPLQSESSSLFQSKHRHLIRERETSTAQRTAWKIGCRTDGRGTKRLSGTPQFGQASPRIRFWIIALVLVKIVATAEPGVGIVVLAFSADVEQQPMVINCRPTTSSGRH